jgi:hypothetical protein
MTKLFVIVLLSLSVFSCNTTVKTEINDTNALPIEGTWRLVSGRVTTNKDTTFTDYTKGQEMIKILNKTHFAFLRHDLSGGKQPDAVYAAGGGTYTLSGNKYSEHLAFFNDRNWENHDFHFTVEIKGDTLFQSGVEKIDSLGVDQVILETYVKVK